VGLGRHCRLLLHCRLLHGGRVHHHQLLLLHHLLLHHELLLVHQLLRRRHAARRHLLLRTRRPSPAPASPARAAHVHALPSSNVSAAKKARSGSLAAGFTPKGVLAALEVAKRDRNRDLLNPRFVPTLACPIRPFQDQIRRGDGSSGLYGRHNSSVMRGEGIEVV
jgi:hypothetical protein